MNLPVKYKSTKCTLCCFSKMQKWFVKGRFKNLQHAQEIMNLHYLPINCNQSDWYEIFSTAENVKRITNLASIEQVFHKRGTHLMYANKQSSLQQEFLEQVVECSEKQNSYWDNFLLQISSCLHPTFQNNLNDVESDKKCQ